MFLLLFCTIDDLYQELVPDPIRRRSQHRRIAFSDSEVLTLSLMQEALSNDSERSFHRFVRKNYLHLFPRLVSRDRYHRRRKALWVVQALLLRHLSQRLAQNARWLVVDSAPIETVKFARSQSGRRSIPEAEYGYVPSEKRVFFGLRLHLLITDEGAVVGFALTPANAPEREAAEGLLAEHAGQYVLGDNGYSGARFREAVALNDHRVLASPKPSQKPDSETEARMRRWLRAKRNLIETVVGMLADQFRLETTRARSLWGVPPRREALGLQPEHRTQPAAWAAPAGHQRPLPLIAPPVLIGWFIGPVELSHRSGIAPALPGLQLSHVQPSAARREGAPQEYSQPLRVAARGCWGRLAAKSVTGCTKIPERIVPKSRMRGDR